MSKTIKVFETMTNAIKGSVVDDKLKIPVTYVVVGFEVERPEDALSGKVHDLNTGEYGHAFFYIVQDGYIAKVFSFGPGGDHPQASHKAQNKGNPWGRLGTPYYPVPDNTVHLFRKPLTYKQADALMKNTERMILRVETGHEKWTVGSNDTCAETAKQLLDASEIDTPSAKGKVKVPTLGTTITVDDPWAWWASFKHAGYQEVVFEVRQDTVTKKRVRFSETEDAMKARIGAVDPVASKWGKQ